MSHETQPDLQESQLHPLLDGLRHGWRHRRPLYFQPDIGLGLCLCFHLHRQRQQDLQDPLPNLLSPSSSITARHCSMP